LRMRALPLSAIYRLSAASSATLLGAFNRARAAGAPSPPNPAVPLPATVWMMPSEVTLRIRLLSLSAM
jgi:hypothetical protein